ncbi:hypothetical protein ATK36_1976 [Amycolatopsis sulphurea]|uniref:Uncharacterized protein n=1 Tax=Amycolatopsis sulphurea TaxID=76022 RepID=A0A2A9F979_9PSEU|nr:hypothetical protein [Amycolatopsis sulphurea]PFG46969.1 hypothetical protein ATK36_1976 [Amycolatopsis sulphurea]
MLLFTRLWGTISLDTFQCRETTVARCSSGRMPADCASGDNLVVAQSCGIKADNACFEVTGTPTYATMQIPESKRVMK